MLQNPLWLLAQHDEYQKTISGIKHYSSLYRKTKILSAHEKGYKDEARNAYLRLAELKDRRRQLEMSWLPILIRINYFHYMDKVKYRVCYYFPEIDALVYDVFDSKREVELRDKTLDISQSRRCKNKPTAEIMNDIRHFLGERFSKRDYSDWRQLRKSLYGHFY